MPQDTTTSLLNRVLVGLRFTLVLATLANQISMAAVVFAESSSAAGENRLDTAAATTATRQQQHQGANGSISDALVESIKMSFNETDTDTMVDEIAALSSAAHNSTHQHLLKQHHQLTNRRIQDTGKADKITAKFSSSSASSPSSAAASTWPTITATLPSSSASTSASYSNSLATTSRVAVSSISTRKTPTGQQQHRKSEPLPERIITPLPLIDRLTDGRSFNSPADGGSSRNILGVFTGSSRADVVVRNQSSLVNDLLQVDEKHFLNEIVKNFNKSIVMNSFEFSPSSTMAANESGANTSNTNHLPRAAVMSVPDNGAIAGGGSVPSLASYYFSTTTTETHTRIPSSSSGSANRNSVPSGSKIHYHKSDSAMLNHIFDSHVKHRHSDLRFGPHFVQVDDIELLNSTAVLGGVGLMSCKISQLQDKTVSWVRRLIDTDEMLLLTVDRATYSSDVRFRVDFQYPDDWRLRIDNVSKADEGTYECQISTHPPQAIQTNFYVSSPEVLIVDEQGLPLYEKFYNLDSLLELKCIVNHITMTMSVVHWYHGDVSLNYDATRGGIRVGTNLSEDAANSTLWVARVNPADSGNYTCSVGPHLFFTTSVHVLNESLAELHHGGGTRPSATDGLFLRSLMLMLLCILLVPSYHSTALLVPTAAAAAVANVAQRQHIR